LVYKVFYLNDELFFYLNHPLGKRPYSLVVFGSKPLSLLEMQRVYLYSSLCGIGKVSIVSSQEVRLVALDVPVKPSQVQFLQVNSIKTEIVRLIKSSGSEGRKVLDESPANLVLCIGKKGMTLPGLPLWCTYSSELHSIPHLNPVTFYKSLEKFSLSEQRNGR